MSEASPQTGAQSPEQKLAPLLALLRNAGQDTKAAIRDAIGTGGVAYSEKPKSTNADARRIAYSAGEIIHPEGFTPEPAEGLVSKLGYDRAKAFMADRHRKNMSATGAMTTMTAREAEQKFGVDSVSPDDLADIARMDFPIDVPGLPAEFGDDAAFAAE